MDIIHLLSRSTTNTATTGSFLDTPGERIGTGVAITVGTLLIILISWMCCCKAKGPRPAPTSYQNKDDQSQDVELGELDTQDSVQVYSMPHELASPVSPPNPAPRPMVPHLTGSTELNSSITADGRVPADENIDKLDPPPKYPGSPIPKSAELAVGK